MTERRVAKIVSEGKRLGQVLIQPQGPRYGPADLSHLDGMGKTGAVVIAFVIDENLRFMFEPTEGG
jgi:hypothetical protein